MRNKAEPGRCSKEECHRRRTSYGRYCRPCASEATRAWRAKNADELRARRRAARAALEPEKKVAAQAAVHVAVLLHRGRIVRPAYCMEESACTGEPRALIVDAALDRRRSSVRWACAQHRGIARSEAAETTRRVALGDEQLAHAVRWYNGLAEKKKLDLHVEIMGRAGVRRAGDAVYLAYVQTAYANRGERL